MALLARIPSISFLRPASHGKSIQVNPGLIEGGFHIHGPRSDVEDEAETHKAFMSALFLTEPKIDRDKLVGDLGQRVGDTCEWITKNNLYTEWFHSQSSQILWLRGPPAVGKTMMSIYLTDLLEATTRTSLDSLLIYYFCAFADDKRNTATAILRGLIFQIVDWKPDLIKFMLRDFERYKNDLGIFHPANNEVLWRNFELILSQSKLKTIYCVLDGLDECERTSLGWFVKKLKSLEMWTDPRVKIILTSRDLPSSIQGVLAGTPHTDLDPEKNRNVRVDLELFISNRTDELVRQAKYEETLKQLVQETLTEGADGTFLWVACAINELRETPRSEVEATLKDLPKGLNGIYQRMLLQIEPDKRKSVAEILRWVATAVRPLNLIELAIVLRIEQSGVVSAEQRIQDLVKATGGFLKVMRTEVHFIHRSAKVYLLKLDAAVNSTLYEFHVSECEANFRVAQRCLEYLRSGALAKGPVDLCEDGRFSPGALRLRDYPFLEYAARYWPKHARMASAEIVGMFDLLDNFYERQPYLREAWLKTYWSSTVPGWETPQNFGVLHLASFFGINELLTHTLSKKSSRTLKVFAISVDQKSNFDMTALHWACRNGHTDTVELLLKKGANISAKGYELTPLSWAVRNGHVDIVRLLLARGAARETKDYGMTPLHWAAWEGKDDVARLLLYNWAEEDAKTSPGTSTLLSFLGESDHRTGEFPGTTPAQAKAINRAVTRAEAEEEARANSDSYLLSACGEIAVLLDAIVLEHVGRTMWRIQAHNRPWLRQRQGIMYGQQVSWAIFTYRGRIRFIFDLLLQPRILLSVFAASGMEIPVWHLVAACYTCSVLAYGLARRQISEAIAYLAFNVMFSEALYIITFITNFHIPYWFWISISALAWMEPWVGYAETSWRVGCFLWLMVQFYCGYAGWDLTLIILSVGTRVVWFVGASIAAKTSKAAAGYTALHLAASRGHAKVIQVLIEYGTNYRLKDNAGRTALQSALRNGHEVAARMLLEYEATSQSQSYAGAPIFHLAAACGYVDILKQFIKLDTNVNEVCDKGWTAIHYAADSGMVQAVRLLLEQGTTQAPTTNQGIVPLHLAAQHGHAIVCLLLLKDWPNVNVKSYAGTTALHLAASNGHLSTVQCLVRAGANPNLADKSGYLPLHSAASAGQEKVVECLLAQSENINVRVTGGATMLYLAAANGHLRVVKYLLGKQADPNILNNAQRSPLHAAVIGGHLEVIQELLASNAALDQADELGSTSLHLAIYRPKANILDCLIEAGANPNLIDRYGRTPYDWAQEYPALRKSMTKSRHDPDPVSSPVRSRMLRGAVVNLAQELLQKPAEDRDYNTLGSCLVQLRHKEDARIAFEHSIGDGAVFKGFMCDSCGDQAMTGTMFVCMTCHDFALCTSCMKRYEERILAPYLCRNHEYLKISAHSQQFESAASDHWLEDIIKTCTDLC